jgi:site-specific DNA-methyltransferase (adenine-specific)
MFASPALLIQVGGVVDKYFNILNTIRWVNTRSMPFRCRREELRQYLNPSKEIIFAEQFVACDGMNIMYAPLKTYMHSARTQAKLSHKQRNKLLRLSLQGVDYRHIYLAMLNGCHQQKKHYNILKQHTDLKPYGKIKTEYEAIRKTFNLVADKSYNHTWNFKQTPSRQGRHPCEKPEELISHIIDVSSNEGDLVVDMFCGSCVVPKCCEKMNRRCIAGDLDDT